MAKELMIIIKEQETTRDTEINNIQICSDVCKILNNKLLSSTHPQFANDYILWDKQDNLPIVVYSEKNLSKLWKHFISKNIPAIVRFDREMDVKAIAIFYESKTIYEILSINNKEI